MSDEEFTQTVMKKITLTPIERLPVTCYFLYKGIMQKCNHNITTKGYAPRNPGWRTCCVCHQITWFPAHDDQYMTNGEYDEAKIKNFAVRDNVPYYPVIPLVTFRRENN